MRNIILQSALKPGQLLRINEVKALIAAYAIDALIWLTGES
ncbi:hypothetical protein [Pediococcus acidilactici]|nr:hypothetical protein [Pediococcus acidilactici]MDB8874270.1 hypothetical protein [Pediococcus acidilactici]